MKFIAKTLFGFEDLLVAEIQKLGGNDVTRGNRAVYFSGDQGLLYRVNYCSRIALSVLQEVSSFRIGSADELYRKSLKIDWLRYLGPGSTFAITPVVKSTFFNHTGFAGLKLKDAVADYFRGKFGERPSVDTRDPDVAINLHISNDKVTISIDSSGEPLFKRGYRTESVAAPLNEVLAAGLIQLSGWDSISTFLDPMCGSGTLPIEAAMLAGNIPPGIVREKFGFTRWKDFDEALFNEIKSEADSGIKEMKARIIGSDISPRAVDIAIRNARTAGLDSRILFSTDDINDLEAPPEKGLIVMNPPYGERIGAGQTGELYGRLGSVLKHRFAGFTAWLITPDKEALKKLGLRPVKKFIVFNGSIECQFLRYDMYEGRR
ncbi:MAG: THUMP domain-containing protein [Bacteroidales bacterium]